MEQQQQHQRHQQGGGEGGGGGGKDRKEFRIPAEHSAPPATTPHVAPRFPPDAYLFIHRFAFIY